MSNVDELLYDVEKRFEAIRARYRDRMQCAAGCTDCCRCRLALTGAEAAFIRRGLAELPRSVRQALAARARAGGEMCPALDTSGRCQIYASRPLVCRSEGAPLRYRYPVPLIHPSQIDVCDKNFEGVDLRSFPSDDVLDQTSFRETLAAIDGDDSESCDRVPLAQILADCV